MWVVMSSPLNEERGSARIAILLFDFSFFLVFPLPNIDRFAFVQLWYRWTRPSFPFFSLPPATLSRMSVSLHCDSRGVIDILFFTPS